MIALRDGFAANAEAFDWCEAIIKKNSKSFYRAFSILPPRKRKSVYAVYAFCRIADDSVDEQASAALLDDLESNLECFLSGSTPQGPLWQALDTAFSAFSFEEQPFFDMIEGQRRDLAFRQPRTLAELEDYSYYVAGSVGLMLLPLLHSGAPIEKELRESAISLGVAMQLTNILRDVGEDYENGRIYLPQSMLENVPYTEEDLAAHAVNDSFISVWEAIARRSEKLYLPMQGNIFELDEDSRLATLSSLYLYRGILDQVRKDGYRCLEHRSSVPKATSLRLVADAEAYLRSAKTTAAARIDTPAIHTHFLPRTPFESE